MEDLPSMKAIQKIMWSLVEEGAVTVDVPWM